MNRCLWTIFCQPSVSKYSTLQSLRDQTFSCTFIRCRVVWMRSMLVDIRSWNMIRTFSCSTRPDRVETFFTASSKSGRRIKPDVEVVVAPIYTTVLDSSDPDPHPPPHHLLHPQPPPRPTTSTLSSPMPNKKLTKNSESNG